MQEDNARELPTIKINVDELDRLPELITGALNFALLDHALDSFVTTVGAYNHLASLETLKPEAKTFVARMAELLNAAHTECLQMIEERANVEQARNGEKSDA